MTELRGLPSVEQLLQTRLAAEIVAVFGRPLTLDAIRTVIEELREKALQGHTIPQRQVILGLVRERLEKWIASTMLPVINATGVILHTNLGRAPLSRLALTAINEIACGYATLEFDLEKGTRGSRTIHAEELLKRITGAEAALVVNNNAAAVLLVITALARRRRVLISRTQLVEIGGGFRVPDILQQCGAILIEIGTTNRVHLSDYEQVLEQESIAVVLHAHHSNFKITGFTSEPEFSDLVASAHRAGVPVVDDLGSGALIDTGHFGLVHEPTVQESLKAGADLVCFSGDKLLGGPQAGIIVGRKSLIEKVKRHPLARVVRSDKLCLAALTGTLLHYLKDEVEREVPIWKMVTITSKQIKARAERWKEVLGMGEVVAGFSTIGGGSLPEETLPTFLLSISSHQPHKLVRLLRNVNPPIISRIEGNAIVLDPRTVLPDQEGALLVGLQNAVFGKVVATTSD
jgi:L-seryl-tRNA(Ser) seleniumtransferase